MWYKLNRVMDLLGPTLFVIAMLAWAVWLYTLPHSHARSSLEWQPSDHSMEDYADHTYPA